MKIVNFLRLFGICLFSLYIVSCEDDVEDFEPVSINPPAINSDSNFAINRTSYNLKAALGNQVTVDGTEGYQFVFIGNGLTAINGVIEGRGAIVQLVLFKNDNPREVSGTYLIRDNEANLTAQLAYSLEFDPSVAGDADDQLASGTVVVEELANNQIRMTISDAVTTTGMQDFTLFFEGGVLVLN
ncbi:hypothetical protein [Nonlabens marinus]|uniref:Uncharacterized protein n=1 Tax=Nonlabens marinus S1-08 TaxID=1454201 RepID=W8VR36_9FLAO|nr:hypothetical protein [Nonlabens marinus]BAO55425.1 hypothetical protein NMS_1416 [Nonlabens marinus S1-08]